MQSSTILLYRGHSLLRFYMDTLYEIRCVHCGKPFTRNCACKIHEKWCKLNPAIKPVTSQMVKQMCICIYCKREKFTTVSGNSNHQSHCSKNPNRVPAKSHRAWTADERKRQSDKMKQAIKEGRAHGWASVKQNIGGMSYPEVWFANMLTKNNIGQEYEYNKQFFKYKLDFAWTNRRLCIEIDGSQHETIPDRKRMDQEKDALLAENGWKVLRLKWGYIFTHPNDAIELVKKFLTGVGDLSVPEYKTRAELAHERRMRCETDGVQKNKRGWYCRSMLREDEILRRKEMILTSGVDLTKPCWIKQVSDTTGLTRQAIYKLVERCPDIKQIVYRRTPCGKGERRQKNPIYVNGHISDAEFERRLNIILDTGVDFNKRGWRKYVMDKTGFSREIVRTTLNHYAPRFNYRKCSKKL